MTTKEAGVAKVKREYFSGGDGIGVCACVVRSLWLIPRGDYFRPTKKIDVFLIPGVNGVSLPASPYRTDGEGNSFPLGANLSAASSASA